VSAIPVDTLGDGEDPAAQPRRLPIGAEIRDEGVHVRVWAPAVRTMEVAIVDALEAPAGQVRALHPLTRERDGHHSGLVTGARAGDLYLLRLDGERLRPDPVSRFQPAGPHGPSAIVDPFAYEWQAQDWPAPGSRPDVVYELHVGTFSREGTWEGAVRRLPDLAALGVTMLEVMPVSEFTGRFGWGYDGVCLFAPYHRYGPPDAFRRFIDEAHHLGLAVVLDVVYNHCGPDGCYLREFAPEYFTTRHDGEWGDPINFDGPGSHGVREWVVANARYWVTEYRLDGLRLDATQAVFDASEPHIIRELIEAARATTERRLWFVAENEPQDSRLVRDPAAGGHFGDALWNDDFHHSALVAATGQRDAYYTDYEGTAQELVSAAKYGYLYQGQYYSWQKKGRGSYALDLPPRSFVCFLENHDQVANSLHGRRLHQMTSPGRFRALSALLLLGPWIPMLFQGQEWGSATPFLYFADMPEPLRTSVSEGRREFLQQFPGTREWPAFVADPSDPATFERARLEPTTETDTLRLYRDLIRLRHQDTVLRAPGRLDGAVLGDRAFVLRCSRGEPTADRLLIVNLGPTLRRPFVAEPLVAPPPGMAWRRVWDSERADYGGNGLGELNVVEGFRVAGECAVLLAPGDPGSATGQIVTKA
jgi:maltooligosyltrehalose trehalohydrolase